MHNMVKGLKCEACGYQAIEYIYDGNKEILYCQECTKRVNLEDIEITSEIKAAKDESQRQMDWDFF